MFEFQTLIVFINFVQLYGNDKAKNVVSYSYSKKYVKDNI